MDDIYKLVDIIVSNTNFDDAGKAVLHEDLLSLYVMNVSAWIMENMDDDHAMELNEYIESTDDTTSHTDMIEYVKKNSFFSDPNVEAGILHELRTTTSTILEQLEDSVPDSVAQKAEDFIDSLEMHHE